MRVLCALLISIASAYGQQFTVATLAHQPLTNESIVTLAKAGFDELFLAQLMRSSRTNFDTSVEGLVKLKKEGLSEDIIRYMAMPQTIPPQAPAVAAPAAKTAPPKKKGAFGWMHPTPSTAPASQR